LAARCRVHKISPDDLRLRDMKPHDLRRTAGSYAVQGGASMAIVAAALGHSDQRVTADHYGHLNDSPVRDLMNANAAKILVGVEVKP
jgi:integrase